MRLPPFPLPGLVFLPLLALLAACAATPLSADFALCEAQASSEGPADFNPRRPAAIESCLAAKGWRPGKACVETSMQATRFCEYER